PSSRGEGRWALLQGGAVGRRHPVERLVERSEDRGTDANGASQRLNAGGDPAHDGVPTVHETAELVLLVGERLHDDVEVRQDSIELLLTSFTHARQRTKVCHRVVERRKGGIDV